MKKTLLFTAMVVATIISILPCAIADDHYAAQNGQTPDVDSKYTNWGIAASNIQDAVNAANTNDTVWVGAGHYTVPTNAVAWMGTNVVYINMPMTLRSSNSVPATTIIDGNGANRGITVNCLADTINRFVIDGFTVSNCYATNSGGGILFYGNFMLSWNAVARNCVIADNTVTNGNGGGIYMYTNYKIVSLLVSNCVIRGNRAMDPGYGGGVWMDASNTVITKCIIESNSAHFGGGVYFGNSAKSTMTENCVIGGNRAVNHPTGSADASGGGLCLVVGVRHSLRNCLIYDNVSGYEGGGISMNNSIVEIYNCTIVSNKATTRGSGIGFRYDSGFAARLRVWNSVIYSNASDLFFDGVGEFTNSWFTNSCLTSTNWGVPSKALQGSGNITNNPKFVNFTGCNFRLLTTSPCINAGLNQSWMEGAKDLDYHARIDRLSGRVDIGCYEYLPKGMIFKTR